MRTATAHFFSRRRSATSASSSTLRNTSAATTKKYASTSSPSAFTDPFPSTDSRLLLRRGGGVGRTSAWQAVQHYDSPLQPGEPLPKFVNPSSAAPGWWSVNWSPYFAVDTSYDSSSATSKLPSSVGYEVPYRFTVADLNRHETTGKLIPSRMLKKPRRSVSSSPTYADFSGLRFPTLDTTTNYRYWNDTGMDRLLARVFPLHIPKHRKLDPVLREFLHFLHTLDVRRFSFANIGERYGLKSSTVERACRSVSVKLWLQKAGLCREGERQITRNEAAMQIKEYVYANKLGYDQIGDEEIVDDDKDDASPFRGWRGTLDWINLQNTQVEMMSAFPLPNQRNPLPKRVDVDLPVYNTRTCKVVNWIDPTDKVVF